MLIAVVVCRDLISRGPSIQCGIDLFRGNFDVLQFLDECDSVKSCFSVFYVDSFPTELCRNVTVGSLMES